MWQQRLEQRLAGRVSSLQGNVAVQESHDNVDASLRREIDDLKKMMLDMQKQIVDL